ncbi:hypothetical protein [Paraburkholderia jirisanensis]
MSNSGAVCSSERGDNAETASDGETDALDCRILIAFPFLLAELLADHNQGPGTLLAVEAAVFVVVFGVLGLLFLWVARKNEELARQIELLP